MSKNARICILFLIILLLGVFTFAGKIFLDKQRIDSARIALEQQVAEYQTREKKYISENKDMKDSLAEAEKIKTELETKVAGFDGDLEQLQSKIKELSTERDNWKKRVDAMRGERDALLVKLQEKPVSTPVKDAAEPASSGGEIVDAGSAVLASSDAVVDGGDEGHWAQVLKEKTSLQLDIEELNRKLNASNLEVEELKKQNSDLHLELTKLQDDKTAIEREIKYGNDLADSLSLELARAQNDKKFLGDRVNKIIDENTKLRDEIKQLTSTKIALEKSIVRLQEDKKGIEKKLDETEHVIQSRIDEIWQLKDSLDVSMKTPPEGAANHVELTPIVVSSQGADPVPQENAAIPLEVAETHGFSGNIVSINDDNNFVIIDIGEDKGIRLGDSLSVYRGAEYVAGLEVIQVRKDIAAADIKSRVAKIQVGDHVR